MAESELWVDLKTLAPREVPGREDPDSGFLSTIPAAAKPEDNPDQAFLSQLTNTADLVFINPDKVARSRVLSSTLNMPFGAVYDNVDEISKSFDERDPGWFKTAGDSFKSGIGDVYVNTARAMEWAGVPQFITEAKMPLTSLTLLQVGKRIQEAYMPPMTPEEFTFDKLIDPRWWATTPMRSLPSMLSLLPAGLVGAYAGAGGAAALSFGTFGRVVLGSLGATALTRPIESALEAGGTKEEAIRQGLSEDVANERAGFVFKRNMALGGMDLAQLATAFTPLRLVGGAANATLARRIISAVGKTGAVGLMEAGEEAYQTGIQQLARGENMEWNAEMKEGAALGAVFGVGIGVGGSVFTTLTGRLENHMPANLKEEFQANENAARVLGKSDEEAKLSAFDKLADTPGGKTFIEKEMGDLQSIAEGKELPALTSKDMESAIETMGEEEAFTLGEEQGEPDMLAGILTDEDIAAIGEGTSTFEQALGIEPDIGEMALDTPEELTREEENLRVLQEGAAKQGKTIPIIGPTPSLLSEAERAMKARAFVGGKPAGAENVLISEESYQAAVASLKEKTSGLHAGIDPTALADLVKIGVYHIERGLRTFPSWSKRLLEEYGEPIRARLEQIWEAAQDAISTQIQEKVDAILSKKQRATPQAVNAAADEHIRALIESGSELEYRGKTYSGAEKQGQNILLKGDPDKLVKGSNEILLIEESIPFDVPGEDIASRALSKVAERIVAQVEAVEGATQPAKDVKKQIRRTTGQEIVVKMIREDVALRAAFKKAEQSARVAYKSGGKDAIEAAKAEFRDVLMKAKAKAEVFGFREGFRVSEKLTRKEFIEAFKESQEVTKATQKMMIEYINENLPPEVRGKFLNAVVSQVSESKALSVFSQVDALQDKLTRRELLNEIKTLQEFKGQHLAVDYQKKITDLLGDINTKTINRKTLLKLSGLIDFAEAEGMPSGINRTMRANLARLEQVDAADMTTEDLQSLVDMATHLTELGKLKFQLKFKYNERAREKAKAALVASTRNLDPKLSGQNTQTDKLKSGALYAYMETLPGQRVPELLDNYTDGENVRLYKEIWNAEQAANWDKRTALMSAADEISKLGIGELTDEQNVKIMINIRNQEGAEAATITLMEKFGFDEVPTLTPQEQGLIDILKKYSGADVDRIAALYEETKNEPFVRLPNRILPLKYEGEHYLSAEEALLDDHRRTSQAQQGFTQARKGGVKKIPRVDVLGVFELGLDEQKWYVHVQPVLDDAARLVKTKDYVEAAGASGANWWADHLDIMARRGWSASAHFSPFNSVLKAARGNLTKAVLGYRLSTIIMQPFALFDAMAYSSSRWGGTAALEVAKEFTKSWIVPGVAKRTIAGSEKLQMRAGSSGDVAIQEALTAARAQTSLRNKFVANGLALMSKADQRTAAGVQAGIQNILERRGIANAAHEAEQLTDMVSSSSDVSFRPHVLSRGEMARTWFTFGTFALNRWAIIAHDLVAKGVVKGDWQKKFSAALGLSIVIAGTIAEDEARKYLYEMVSQKERKRRSILVDMLFALPSNIPLFGNVFDNFTGGSGTDIPLTKVVGDLLGASKAISADKPEAKAKALLKATEAALTLGAGVPGTSQVFDFVEAIFLPTKKTGSKERVGVAD
jgi:hypothetical protein